MTKGEAQTLRQGDKLRWLDPDGDEKADCEVVNANDAVVRLKYIGEISTRYITTDEMDAFILYGDNNGY